MKYLTGGIVVAVLIWFSTSLFSFGSVCEQTLQYSIGEFDQGFDITQNEFLQAIYEAESVWEEYVGANLFEYNQDATFTINLVFDERQEQTNTNVEFQNALEASYIDYNQKNSDVKKLEVRYTQVENLYAKDVEVFNARKESYDASVSYWNTQGGAPQEEYQKLQKEYQYLEQEFDRLEDSRNNLNTLAQELNSAVQEANVLARDYNNLVEEYSDLFGDAEGFDQGLYTGNAITIYQFNTIQELELVLAHEFGHALGIEHVGNPQALMFYLMDEQKNLSLADEDKEALDMICRDVPWYQKIHFDTTSSVFTYGKNVIYKVL